MKSIEKNSIRSHIVQNINNISQELLLEKQSLLYTSVITWNEFIESTTIGIFIGKDHEPKTIELIHYFLKNKKTVCIPKIINKNRIEFFKISSIELDTQIGTYGLLEPKGSCRLIRSHTIDILFVPAVAVDKQGNRIGRGKGFYDTYLEKSPVQITAALVFDEQIVSHIIPEPHDQPVDFIITEKQIISCPYQQKKLINGTKIAYLLRKEIKFVIKKYNLTPHLTIILVGNHKASEAYVQKKRAACKKVNVRCTLIKQPETIPEKDLISLIEYYNNDSLIDGILVQLPLPNNIDENKVINHINYLKDVDGLTLNSKFTAPTALGILLLIKRVCKNISSKKIVLLGYGKLVGKPLHQLLIKENINPTICSLETKNNEDTIKKADIIIAATGAAHLIKKDAIKKEAIIIDAGFAKINNQCVGDVDFESVFSKTSFIAPSPGGVGPLTIALLLENVIKAHLIRKLT